LLLNVELWQSGTIGGEQGFAVLSYTESHPADNPPEVTNRKNTA